MLTEIQLSHFKAFGPIVRVPLAPLTLLFGGNSAGKSSVFHALHVLREALTRGNLDPDHTELGGGALDLGGFANLAHQHNLAQPVRLTFTLSGLAWLGDDVDDPALRDLADIEFATPPLDRPLRGEPGDESVRLAFELRGSQSTGLVRITAFELAQGSSDHPAVRVESALDRDADARITAIDPWQFVPDPERPALAHGVLREAVDALQRSPRESDAPYSIPLFVRPVVVPSTELPWILWDPDQGEPPESVRALEALLRWASRVALTELVSTLRSLVHVGPVRALPNRAFRRPRSPSPDRWYSGLGAWDELLATPPGISLDELNEWLTRIEAGVELVAEAPIEFDADAFDRALSLAKDEGDFSALDVLRARAREHRRLLAIDEVRKVRVAPRDLGVGMTQLIPVVAAALQRRWGLVAIEQPELHVHPRVTVGLGDLFASARRSKQILIETHSEHLLLRLLRRIRETSAGSLAPDDPLALAPDDVAIVHFDTADGGVIARRLSVDKYGTFLDAWPHGFFEERLREMLGG